MAATFSRIKTFALAAATAGVLALTPAATAGGCGGSGFSFGFSVGKSYGGHRSYRHRGYHRSYAHRHYHRGYSSRRPYYRTRSYYRPTYRYGFGGSYHFSDRRPSYRGHTHVNTYVNRAPQTVVYVGEGNTGSAYNVPNAQTTTRLADVDHAWSVLLAGDATLGQKAFGEAASRDQNDARAKLGYAIASAALRDYDTAAWANRRALTLGADPMNLVPDTSDDFQTRMGRLLGAMYQRVNNAGDRAGAWLTIASLERARGNDAAARTALDQARALGESGSAIDRLSGLLAPPPAPVQQPQQQEQEPVNDFAAPSATSVTGADA
ncbi:MAG: hypothetical protein AAGD00_03705 [Planctomycetota bacterium]